MKKDAILPVVYNKRLNKLIKGGPKYWHFLVISKGDIEYLTGVTVHLSVRDPLDLHMNDLALCSFDQPARAYS